MPLDCTFAEYNRVPARCILLLPAAVPFETGAILTDALATAYHAVYRRGALRAGETVAVFGCGGVGYQAIVFARRAGAARIIAVDTSAGALARAEQAGATDLVAAGGKEPAGAGRALTNGEGVDVAFEFVGKKATDAAALRSLGRPGRAVVVGVGPERVELPPLSVFVGKELALLGSMGSYREDVDEVLRLLADGELDPRASITHRYALAAVNTALEALAQKRGAPVRVVLTP